MVSVSLSRRHLLAGLGAASCASSALFQSARALGSDMVFELHITRSIKEVGGVKGPVYEVNGCSPAPTLRWKEGQCVTLHIINHLDEPTSLHWHGIRLPADQDGVPGLSFKGIPAGEHFTYRFLVPQSGTYWYHSHSVGQEACGLSGALIIDPAGEDPLPKAERDYVMFLSDWSDVPPMQIISNLKMQSNYYTFRQRSVQSFPHESRAEGGIKAALKDRLMWSKMRMAATDISDVSGVIYQYLHIKQSHCGPVLNYALSTGPQ